MDTIRRILNQYNRIVLYGAGKNLRGKWILLSIADYIIDQRVRGTIFGKEVFSPSKLLEEDEKTLVVITSDKYCEEIKEDIADLSSKVAVMTWAEISFPEIEKKNRNQQLVRIWRRYDRGKTFATLSYYRYILYGNRRSGAYQYQ